MAASRDEAHRRLRQRILQLLAHQSDAARLQRELDGICLAGPDAVYEALSLIDQHYRLGRINEHRYRSLKSRASDIALGRVRPETPASVHVRPARPEPAGSPLKRLLGHLPGHRLPLPLALAVVRDIGHAVAALHAQGIAHRPIDLAHVVVNEAGCSELQQPPPPPGTASAGLREDLQALAILACELLSGTHPFKGLDATAAQALQLRLARPPGLKRAQWRLLEQELMGDGRRGPAEPLTWVAALVRHGAARRLPTPAEFASVPTGRRWSWRGLRH